MPIKESFLLTGIMIMFWAPQVSRAQEVPVRPRPDSAAVIQEQFDSGDDAQIKSGLVAAKKLLARSPASNHVLEAFDTWVQTLLMKQKYDQLDELLISTIVAHSSELPFVEECQTLRVRVKLLAGKPAEALSAAKGLYSVCAMANTNDAIDVLCECLVANHPNGDAETIVHQFRLEQVQGAAATRPSDELTAGSVLAGIHSDASSFKEGLAFLEVHAKGFNRLMAEGNLLLLSDDAKLAEQRFRTAYALSSQTETPIAVEAIARALRAEDGAVGRANSWIVSLNSVAQQR